MLPIRWILPVSSILLAIAILALAFTTLDGSRSQMGNVAQVRRSIIEWGERPEWQQFVILGAIQRRAVELNRLRELPDTPARTDHSDSGPKDNNDETVLNVQAPAPAGPIDSGEVELPVAAVHEKPPAIEPPQRVKSHNQNRSKDMRHRVRALARRQLVRQQNFSKQPFGNQTEQRPAVNTNNYYGNWQARQVPTAKTSNYFDNQTGQTPPTNY
ncbi:MAG: hypothetical protein WA322_27310 [Pseudolabrys sp.]